jgi:Fe-S-cluster-containing hydrogenase component 2
MGIYHRAHRDTEHTEKNRKSRADLCALCVSVCSVVVLSCSMGATDQSGHDLCSDRDVHAICVAFIKENVMLELATMVMPVAAAGWAALYMLCGGGLGGAILIFIGLKAIGK